MGHSLPSRMEQLEAHRRPHYPPTARLVILELRAARGHTAVTNVYRASRDLFLAQSFARHASPLTTTAYTHPSDQEMFERVRQLPC